MVLAGGVLAVLYVEGSVLGALGLSSGEVSVLLFGDYFGDVSPLGLEVVLHGFGLILARFVLEHRSVRQFSDGVRHTRGVDGARIEVHLDFCGVHLEILVFDGPVAIQERPFESAEHQRVLGIERHRGFDVDLAAVDSGESCPGGVGRYGVGGDRVLAEGTASSQQVDSRRT